MPSIPQSLLWISLVVLWLFVLVPMLVSKRDAVRRTSDVALATRVLNGGAGAKLLKRTGPAAGHRSDPDWMPEEEPADDEFADTERIGHADASPDADDRERTLPVVMRMAVAERTEPDYLDVDVIEDSAALPAGVAASVAEPVAVDADGGYQDEYEDGYEDGYE
ncbi:MAG: gephyrin-like molybdotransferase receptor GlpR, partial [Mycobacterium sp.]